MADSINNRFVFEEEIPPQNNEGGISFLGKQIVTPEQIGQFKHQAKQKVAVPLSHLFSGAGGLPGDIAALLTNLVGAPIEKAVTDKEPVSYEQHPLSFLLPTSEMIQSGIEKLTGEKLRPETPGEEILATAAQFGGATGKLKAGRLLGKQLSSLPRTILAAAVPAATLTGAKHAELPPGVQAVSTVASSLITHKLTNKSFKEVAGDLYNQANQMAEKVMLPAEPISERLTKLQSKLSEGLSTPPKSRIQSTIKEIEGKISGGSYRLPDLLKWRQDINEISKEFTKEQLKGSQNEWRSLRRVIDETIGDYEKTNPEFGKVYREANSLYRGIQESKSIENFVKSHPILAGAGLAGELTLHALHHALGSFAYPAVGYSLAKLGEFSVALARNPGLRKATANVFKNAAKEDLKGTASALNKMNVQLKKSGVEEKKEEKRFVLD